MIKYFFWMGTIGMLVILVTEQSGQVVIRRSALSASGAMHGDSPSSYTLCGNAGQHSHSESEDSLLESKSSVSDGITSSLPSK